MAKEEKAHNGRPNPPKVLEALLADDVALDKGDTRQKTETLLRSIEYSHSNLSPEVQLLLLCLAPFTDVIERELIDRYTPKLRAQPLLRRLPFEIWGEVSDELANRGLVKEDAVDGYLRIQPVFTNFLKSQLQTPGKGQTKQAIETAFRLLYEEVADSIAGLLGSKEAEKKRMGQWRAGLEWENLSTALRLALNQKVSIIKPFLVLSQYLDSRQDHNGGLELARMVVGEMEKYPAKLLAGKLGLDLVGVIDNCAKNNIALKRYPEARDLCQRALSLWMGNKSFGQEEKRYGSATIYHQLGRVAQEQRQWEQAERYFRQALKIFVEFGTRGLQAGTCHQLGRVAEEQRQWEKAERHYQQALEIYVENNDRSSQAKTCHQLGRVAEEQRQWEQAERYFQQSLAIKIEFNDRYSQAKTYHELGRVAEEQRQWEQAERYYQQALEICLEFDDRSSLANTYHQLARVAEERRQWERACDFFLQALEIFKSNNDGDGRTITLRSLSRLWLEYSHPGIPIEVGRILGISEQESKALLK